MTYEWVMSHMTTYEWGVCMNVYLHNHSCTNLIINPIIMNKPTRPCQSHTQPWLVHMSHESFICETWRIHIRDVTHSYVRHDSCICATWLVHMWDMTHSYVRHDSFICETRLIHMWDMTHAYVTHDSFICETWLIHMWDMTHSYNDIRGPANHTHRHDSHSSVTQT